MRTSCWPTHARVRTGWHHGAELLHRLQDLLLDTVRRRRHGCRHGARQPRQRARRGAAQGSDAASGGAHLNNIDVPAQFPLRSSPGAHAPRAWLSARRTHRSARRRRLEGARALWPASPRRRARGARLACACADGGRRGDGEGAAGPDSAQPGRARLRQAARRAGAARQAACALRPPCASSIVASCAPRLALPALQAGAAGGARGPCCASPCRCAAARRPFRKQRAHNPNTALGPTAHLRPRFAPGV